MIGWKNYGAGLAVLFVLLLPFYCAAQSAPDSNIESIKTRYDETLATIDNTRSQGLIKLSQQYLTALIKQEERAADVGNLGAVVAFKKEQQLMIEVKPLPATDTGVDQVLLKGRTWYRGHVNKIQTTASDQRLKLYRDFESKLLLMQGTLTRQRKIESALAIQKFREEIKKGAQDLLTAAAAVPKITHVQETVSSIDEQTTPTDDGPKTGRHDV